MTKYDPNPHVGFPQILEAGKLVFAVCVEAEEGGPEGHAFIDMAFAAKYPEKINLIAKEAIKLIADIAATIGVTDIFVVEKPIGPQGQLIPDDTNPN